MIDCGEGAQLQMLKMGLSPHRLTNIFLSHLHGDHCLGLIPMLSSMALHQKGGTVTIHTIAEGERILRPMIDFFVGPADFEIKFNIVDSYKRNLLLETKGLIVESFPLFHRVPTMGFKFSEKPKPRHLVGDMLEFYNVPVYQRNAIKNGADFVRPDGTIVENARLTTAPDPSASYAYCSDTVFNKRVVKAVDGVDTIYHEATYEAANAEKARNRGHSTSVDAATVALEAGAKRLVIGHFSKAADESVILSEAKAIFPETILAYEGMRLDI